MNQGSIDTWAHGAMGDYELYKTHELQGTFSIDEERYETSYGSDEIAFPPAVSIYLHRDGESFSTNGGIAAMPRASGAHEWEVPAAWGACLPGLDPEVFNCGDAGSEAN